jgi:Ca-activated chloride channel family protein
MLDGGVRGSRWRRTAAAAIWVAASMPALPAMPAPEAGGVRPAEATSGALLVRAAPAASWQPAPQVATAIELAVTGLVVRAELRQRFLNPSAERVEALYVFPLPDGAAIDTFELEVGSRRIVGEVRERQAARRTYERARDEGRRAALLEQNRPNLFRVAVAGIDPGSEVTVRLGYQELARYDAGEFRLRVPLAVTPRFVPPFPFEPEGGDELPIATLHAAPVQPGSAPTATIAVTVDAGIELERLDSPSHRVRTRRGRRGWKVDLAAGAAPADRDFELVWRPRRSALPRVARFEEEVDGERYVALFVLPPTPGAAATSLARDLVLVLDTSGSMDGASIEQAKRAVRFALSRLEPHDRFNLIRFADHAEALFDDVVAADPHALAIAEQWLAGTSAGGGTHMMAALERALTPGGSGAVRQVLFVTDGAVGNEGELFVALERRLGDSRLFTVGIGSAPNSYFMRRAAELGRGTHTYVGQIAEVERRMSELLAKLERPVAADLELDWGDPTAEPLPARPPDLYLGEPLVVVARLEDPRAPAVLRGRRAGEPFELELPPVEPVPAAGLARLWARRRIDALEAAMREPGADREALRVELVELAVARRLMSRHTSFVAVERQPSASGPPVGRQVAALLPAGSTLGELPQGATSARQLLGLALAAAFAGGLLRRIGNGWRER